MLAPDTYHAEGFMKRPQKTVTSGALNSKAATRFLPRTAITKRPSLVPVSSLAPPSSLCSELLNKLGRTQSRARLPRPPPLQVQTKLVGPVQGASPATPAAPPYAIGELPTGTLGPGACSTALAV